MTKLRKFREDIEVNKLRTIDELRGKVKQWFSDEEILSMAQNYALPHYILQNPLNDKKVFLFNGEEVEAWLRENLIQRNRCELEYDLTFLHFNYEALRVTCYDQVPLELCKIKGLYKLPKTLITSPPGIYFLCKDMELVYIGQSCNPPNRIASHIAEGEKDFDTIFFIPCNLEHLTKLEATLIRMFKPKYNLTPGAKSEVDEAILKAVLLEDN